MVAVSDAKKLSTEQNRQQKTKDAKQHRRAFADDSENPCRRAEAQPPPLPRKGRRISCGRGQGNGRLCPFFVGVKPVSAADLRKFAAGFRRSEDLTVCSVHQTVTQRCGRQLFVGRRPPGGADSLHTQIRFVQSVADDLIIFDDKSAAAIFGAFPVNQGNLSGIDFADRVSAAQFQCPISAPVADPPIVRSVGAAAEKEGNHTDKNRTQPNPPLFHRFHPPVIAKIRFADRRKITNLLAQIASRVLSICRFP